MNYKNLYLESKYKYLQKKYGGDNEKIQDEHNNNTLKRIKEILKEQSEKRKNAVISIEKHINNLQKEIDKDDSDPAEISIQIIKLIQDIEEISEKVSLSNIVTKGTGTLLRTVIRSLGAIKSEKHREEIKKQFNTVKEDIIGFTNIVSKSSDDIQNLFSKIQYW